MCSPNESKSHYSPQKRREYYSYTSSNRYRHSRLSSEYFFHALFEYGLVLDYRFLYDTERHYQELDYNLVKHKQTHFYITQSQVSDIIRALGNTLEKSDIINLEKLNVLKHKAYSEGIPALLQHSFTTRGHLTVRVVDDTLFEIKFSHPVRGRAKGGRTKVLLEDRYLFHLVTPVEQDIIITELQRTASLRVKPIEWLTEFMLQQDDTSNDFPVRPTTTEEHTKLKVRMTEESLMKAISLVFTQFYPEEVVEDNLSSFRKEIQSKGYTVTNPFITELRLKGYSFRIEVINLNDKYRVVVTLEEVLF
uniref:Uncharacterized protein n=1 Tax=Myoviridae sp. ctLnO19 TaxID=2825085 RepID=A0A8S5NZU2_9CAUD|nr:MAG TPA: hypothetical protein [Myoviridae sp. ctLnO19]